jgi:DNA-binding transcriptional regulator YdaS (Cro superfamily)
MIRAAIDAAIAHFDNSQINLARALKLRSPNISSWYKHARVPPKHAPLIEELCDGKVTKEQLCPEFPWPSTR